MADPDGTGPSPGILAAARRDPGRPAVLCGERTVAYGELESLVSGVARSLDRAGIGAGDRVAVMLGNTVELLAVWNGVAQLGGVVVPISPRLTAPEIAYLLADSQAAALVHADPALVDELGVDGAGVDLLGSDARLRATWDVAGPDLWANVGEPWLETPYSASTVATLPYTSGTTGRPKAVIKRTTADPRLLISDYFRRYWDIRASDRYLLAGPAYHGGPGSYAQLHLMVGGSVVIMPRFDAASCLELIERHRVTTSFMVPAHFTRILAEPWADHDRSSLRLVVHAAASCPPSLKARMYDVFPPGVLWEYYGAIEGSFTMISPGEWQIRPGSVGRPLPGVRLAILDEAGEPVPAGKAGFIYSTGLPGSSFEYLNDPEKTARAWRGDMFTVGDIGRLDDEGYLYILDRRTDMIISGGVNIYAAEVEAALVELPEVVDAAVFGVPDDSMGQVVHAVIEARPGSDPSAEVITRGLEGRLAKFKWPRSVEFVSELPREPNGKVRKFELRRECLAAAGSEKGEQ